MQNNWLDPLNKKELQEQIDKEKVFYYGFKAACTGIDDSMWSVLFGLCMFADFCTKIFD